MREQPAIVVASNRGPVAIETGADGAPTVRRGSGGLVTALTASLLAITRDTGSGGKQISWPSSGFTEWMFEGITVVIAVKTGDDGKMFGSVTSGAIADELKKQLDVALDKKKIHLEHPIRALGDYEVELRLHPDVKSSLKVRVESNFTSSDKDEDGDEIEIQSARAPNRCVSPRVSVPV